MNTQSAIVQQIASFRTQALGSLFSSGTGTTDFAAALANASPVAAQPALRDPAAARQMMTRINDHETRFKAQYATLAAMGHDVGAMGEAGQALGDAVAPETGDAEIERRLRDFVAAYNDWENRYDQDLERGGLLDNVQAAEVARTRLERSVRNPFNGSVDGVNGLGALGVTINPVTRQAEFDPVRLGETLATNRAGAIAAIDAFAADIDVSADTLNGEDNIIRHQLDNRQRAIDFIANNRSALTAEFGAGDTSRPSADVARAVAAYEAMRA